ncbi:MAG: hypothetical protein HGA54_06755 [Actinobacteria bacterium]|nr:hypothetical protein [Actinomycetota bacterium]
MEECERNRKNPAYKTAVDDMLGRTSTEYHSWTIIEPDDKSHCQTQPRTIEGAKTSLCPRRIRISTPSSSVMI